MSPEQARFLGSERLPALSSVAECGYLLGLAPHEVVILLWLGLLKDCGRRPRNGKILFATVTIQRLGEEPKALARLRTALADYWHNKSVRRKSAQRRGGKLNGPPTPPTDLPDQSDADERT
jgi:hypothetical protein